MSPVQIVVLILGTIIAIANIISMGVFWKFRKFQPVRGRFYVLVIITMFWNLMFTLQTTTRGSGAIVVNQICHLSLTTRHILLRLIVSVGAVRAWKLLCLIKSTKIKTTRDKEDLDVLSFMLADGDELDPDKERFCCTYIDWLNPKLISNSLIQKVVCFVMLFEITVMISIVIAGSTVKAEDCPTFDFTAEMVYCGFYVINAIWACQLFYQFRQDFDTLHIKWELYAVMIGLSTCIPLGHILSALSPINSTGESIGYLILLIPCANNVYASLIYPVLKIRESNYARFERVRDSYQESFKVGLQEVLDIPQAFEYFRKFTEMEFSQENALFYRDVRKYRALPTFERTAFAVKMRQKYLMKHSDYFINLSADVTHQLRARLQLILNHPTVKGTVESGNRFSSAQLIGVEAPTDLFDEAQAEIFNLMEADSFIRFSLSDTFQKVVKNIEFAAHHRKITAAQDRDHNSDDTVGGLVHEV